MALSATVLKGLITTKVTAATAGGPLQSPDAMFEAIAEAIVEHFTAAAVVTATGVSPPGGGPVPSTGTIS